MLIYKFIYFDNFLLNMESCQSQSQSQALDLAQTSPKKSYYKSWESSCDIYCDGRTEDYELEANLEINFKKKIFRFDAKITTRIVLYNNYDDQDGIESIESEVFTQDNFIKFVDELDRFRFSEYSIHEIKIDEYFDKNFDEDIEYKDRLSEIDFLKCMRKYFYKEDI
jgi:hypothetical protein